MPDACCSKRPTVLVVEDDALMRLCAVELFEEIGFAVLEAEDGVEALARLHAHPEVTLLFTDCVMPRMDGLTLAGEASRRHPDLPIVLATGHMGFCPSAWPVLGKPYSARDVVRLLNRVLPQSLRDAA